MAIIEVHDLVTRYGDHTTVNGVCFSVEQGKVFGCDAGASPTIHLSRHQSAQGELTGRAVL